MNKYLELELVKIRIQDIREQIDSLEFKLVDLERRKIELENEIGLNDENHQNNQNNVSEEIVSNDYLIDQQQQDLDWNTSADYLGIPEVVNTNEEVENLQQHFTTLEPESGNSSGSRNNFDRTRTKQTLTYSCSFCSKQFRGNSNLTYHIRVQHNREKLLQCSQCDYKTAYPSDLTKHFRKHSGEKPFTCDICQKSFSRSDYLKTHKTNMHRFMNSDSPFSFSSLKAAAVRRRSDAKKTATTTNTLSVSFCCQFCGKIFAQKDRLERHLKLHTNSTELSLPYSCHFCPRKFSFSQNLTVHLRSAHTGENMYNCTQCDYKTAKSSDLTKHFRKHSGEKPFTCDVCQKSFSRSDYLKLHKKKLHTKKIKTEQF